MKLRYYYINFTLAICLICDTNFGQVHAPQALHLVLHEGLQRRYDYNGGCLASQMEVHSGEQGVNCSLAIPVNEDCIVNTFFIHDILQK